MSIKRETPALPDAQAAAAPMQSAPTPSGDVAVQDTDDGSAVTAFMSGTCYLASESGAAPFVQVGDTVRKGQTLCLIEAMKVMTGLTAEWDGTVTEICVQDGVVLTAGDLVMRVQP